MLIIFRKDRTLYLGYGNQSRRKKTLNSKPVVDRHRDGLHLVDKAVYISLYANALKKGRIHLFSDG